MRPRKPLDGNPAIRTMMVRRHPPAVDYRAPGTDPCRFGPLFQSLNSVPRRLSFFGLPQDNACAAAESA